MPFDIASTRVRAASARPDQLEQLAPSRAPRRSDPARRWCRREELVGGHPAGEPEQLRQVAERARARAREPAGWPPTSTSPALGRTSPQAILVRVDFPAPFGPSSPTSSPSPTSRLTPPKRLGLPVALRDVAGGEGGATRRLRRRSRSSGTAAAASGWPGRRPATRTRPVLAGPRRAPSASGRRSQACTRAAAGSPRAGPRPGCTGRRRAGRPDQRPWPGPRGESPRRSG